MTTTASGATLRDWIKRDTGADPVSEPAFAWSNTLPCDGCGVPDSTALVSFDGKTFERLCLHCYEVR